MARDGIERSSQVVKAKAVFVKSQIKNHHNAQKWLWVFLTGFAVLTSTRDLVDDFSWSHLLWYFLFMVLLYRFFVGDNRILDYIYDSVPDALCEIEDRKAFREYVVNLSDVRMLMFDGISRVAQLLILLAAAAKVGEPERFVHLLVPVLLVNALICSIAESLEHRRGQGRTTSELVKEVLGYELDLGYCRRVWAYNNVTFAFLLLAAMVANLTAGAGAGLLIWIAYLLLLANSAIDLFAFEKVREIYIPRFSRWL